MSIQARWVDDAVRLGSVFMKLKRPCPREALARRFRDICRHAHPDRMVLTQIDKVEFRVGLDFRVAPGVKFFLLDWKVSDEAVASVAQNCFQETDLEGVAKIKNANRLAASRRRGSLNRLGVFP